MDDTEKESNEWGLNQWVMGLGLRFEIFDKYKFVNLWVVVWRRGGVVTALIYN